MPSDRELKSSKKFESKMLKMYGKVRRKNVLESVVEKP